MASPATPASQGSEGFAARVVGGVMWRSGAQIAAQFISWFATFLVIRLLAPADYGLFAMTQSVLVLFGMLSGYTFASALVRDAEVTPARIAQVIGLLILLNAALAIAQLLLAPLVAAYYRQPLVADLLRVQTLLYAANPPIALCTALLSRELDFRCQALAHLASAVAGAVTALTGALAGWGVWTLVLAPIAMFWTRAIVLMAYTRPPLRPSFRFAGAGDIVGYGGALLASQMFWFVQTQADVFIGGRALDPHDLGLYTTALFLAQILTAKFLPPMNEVAFSAYARLQDKPVQVADAFERQVRIMMLVTLPFSVGMAMTAAPLVMTVLGEHWIEAVPAVRLLALAMPVTMLQLLFAPVVNALGKPRRAVWAAVAGAAIMPAGFALGVGHGPAGLAIAWLAGMPLLLAITAALSLPVIGLGMGRLARAVAPLLLATLGMTAALLAAEAVLPAMPTIAMLAVLVAVGAASYALLAGLLARRALAELAHLIRHRSLPG